MYFVAELDIATVNFLALFSMTAILCSESNLDVYTSRMVCSLKGRIYQVANLTLILLFVFKMCLSSVFVATNKIFCSLLRACLPITEILARSRAEHKSSAFAPLHQQSFSYYL